MNKSLYLVLAALLVIGSVGVARSQSSMGLTDGDVAAPKQLLEQEKKVALQACPGLTEGEVEAIRKMIKKEKEWEGEREKEAERNKQPLSLERLSREDWTMASRVATLNKVRADMKAAEDRVNSDKDFLDPNMRLKNAILGSLMIKAGAGYTDQSQTTLDPSSSSAASLKLTDDWAFNVQIGYSGRPILRDIFLLTGDQARLGEYRNWGPGSPIRWAFFEAFKFDAYFSYGRQVDPTTTGSAFKTSDKGGYYVGARYEVPLENLGQPFKEK
jgi:hypothetical protein